MKNKRFTFFTEAYQGIDRSIWLLSVSMFINRMGTMVFPYLSLYLTQHLGFSLAQAGTILSLYGAGALVGTYLGGRLTDRFGHFYIQVISLLCTGTMLLGMMFIKDYPIFCLLIFFYTIFADAFRPANSSAIAAYSTAQNRTRAYTLNRLAINLGWSIGAGLGGFLAYYNYNLLFIVDGITCIGSGIFILIYLNPTTQRQSILVNDSNTNKPIISPYKDHIFLLFSGLVLCFAISFFFLFSVIPLYFKQVLGLNEKYIGVLQTLNGLIIVAFEMFLVIKMEQLLPKMKTIAIGLFLTGFSFLVLSFNTWAGVAVFSLILVTFGEMFAMPFMQSFVSQQASDQNRGQYLAVYAMSYSVAQISSPVIATGVVDAFGYNILWYGTFVFCSLAGVGFWLLQKKFD